MTRSIGYLAAAGLAALLLGGGPARADDPALLTFQGGVFDVIQSDDEAAAFALEYRHEPVWWQVKPFGGMMGTADGAFHGYAGIVVDVPLGDSFAFTIGFAPGYFHEGGGKDLGHALEFRSSGELAYVFENKSRLGLMVNHISNASLSDRNPGTEVLMLSYSVPVRKLFGE